MRASAQQPTSVEVEGVIIRADGTREELGRLAYYHRNPVRRWLGRMRQRGGPFAGRFRGLA